MPAVRPPWPATALVLDAPNRCSTMSTVVGVAPAGSDCEIESNANARPRARFMECILPPPGARGGAHDERELAAGLQVRVVEERRGEGSAVEGDRLHVDVRVGDALRLDRERAARHGDLRLGE